MKSKKKKKAELQVIKQSHLGYYHFTGENLIFGEKEDCELSKKIEVTQTERENWGKHSDAVSRDETF